jgi:predicted Zn-dependent protease
VEAILGNGTVGRSQAALALRLSAGADAQYRAAAALCWVGSIDSAESIARNLNQQFPTDTIVQFVYLPALRAQVSLGRNDGATAIEALQPALAYDLADGMYPAYIRGMALLAANQPDSAAREFRKILDHPGIVLNSPVGVLTQLQMARTSAILGDLVKARNRYQEFLSLWKDADPDISILAKAKAELANLGR